VVDILAFVACYRENSIRSTRKEARVKTLLHICPFRILTGTPTTLVEVSCGYPQFLKANAEMFGPVRP
jgi:hypothetical protein